MSSEKDTALASKGGGASTSATPSIATLNRRLGVSPAPWMLTPCEIDSLRRCAKEAMDVAYEVFVNEETDSPN